ncbi:hypothetical protein [Kibdelosporangium philippinense]
MTLQAWGTYGTLWPVVNQQLGVSPDLGNGRLAVIPQLPPDQNSISGRDIRVGAGCVDVSVSRSGNVFRTSVQSRSVSAALTVGLVVPSPVSSVLLDGKPVKYSLVQTTRGTEVHVAIAATSARVEVRTR